MAMPELLSPSSPSASTVSAASVSKSLEERDRSFAPYEKLGASIAVRARALQSDQDRPLAIRDDDWLTRSHRRMLVSRQVLSRLYVFAYYMFGGGTELRTCPATKRRVACGPLGLGPMTVAEEARLAFAEVVHVPLRIAPGVPVLPGAAAKATERGAHGIESSSLRSAILVAQRR